MHKSNYDDKVFEDWIRKDLNQLSKHYDKIKDKYEIKHAIGVSNLNYEKNKELASKFIKELGEKFTLAHITSLPQIIEHLIKKS